MEINIVNKTKNKELKKFYPLIKEYYLKTLKVLNLKDEYNLSLVIVGPLTIKKINREYRHLDNETDVISFALLDSEEMGISEDSISLGDIFINHKRVISQAQEYGHSIKREFIFLFVHGLLHLLGYDHMNAEDEAEMFSLQKKILGNLK